MPSTNVVFESENSRSQVTDRCMRRKKHAHTTTRWIICVTMFRAIYPHIFLYPSFWAASQSFHITRCSIVVISRTFRKVDTTFNFGNQERHYSAKEMEKRSQGDGKRHQSEAPSTRDTGQVHRRSTALSYPLTSASGTLGQDAQRSLALEMVACPLGLLNHGNTCYLNSVLQCLFQLRPIWRTILPTNVYNVEGVPQSPSEILGMLTASAFLAREREIHEKFCLTEPQLGQIYSSALLRNGDSKLSKEMVSEIFVSLFLPQTVRDIARMVQSGQTCEDLKGKGQKDAHEFLMNVLDSLTRYSSFRKQERGSGTTKPELVTLSSCKGQWRVTRKCHCCGFASPIYEFWTTLSLPVRRQHRVQTLIKELLSPELLTGSSRYFCSKCEKYVDADQITTLTKLPDVLILQLQVFERDLYGSTKKIQYKSGWPDSLRFRSGDAIGDQAKLYTLRGVVAHSGKTVTSGHYIAFVKQMDSGHWFRCDDDVISFVPEAQFQHLISSVNRTIYTPYLMFYDAYSP